MADDKFAYYEGTPVPLDVTSLFFFHVTIFFLKQYSARILALHRVCGHDRTLDML